MKKGNRFQSGIFRDFSFIKQEVRIAHYALESCECTFHGFCKEWQHAQDVFGAFKSKERQISQNHLNMQWGYQRINQAPPCIRRRCSIKPLSLLIFIYAFIAIIKSLSLISATDDRKMS